jgi:hypothetical protein
MAADVLNAVDGGAPRELDGGQQRVGTWARDSVASGGADAVDVRFL